MITRLLMLVVSVLCGLVAGMFLAVSATHGSAAGNNGCMGFSSVPNSQSKATYAGVSVMIERFSLNPMAEGGNAPKSGNAFYVAHVLIMNNSATNYRYDDNDFSLQAPDATAYQRPGAGWLRTLLGFGVLAPHDRIAGDIVYEAPAKQHFRMLWRVSYNLPPLVIGLPPLGRNT